RGNRCYQRTADYMRRWGRPPAAAVTGPSQWRISRLRCDLNLRPNPIPHLVKYFYVNGFSDFQRNGDGIRYWFGELASVFHAINLHGDRVSDAKRARFVALENLVLQGSALRAVVIEILLRQAQRLLLRREPERGFPVILVPRV